MSCVKTIAPIDFLHKKSTRGSVLYDDPDWERTALETLFKDSSLLGDWTNIYAIKVTP